MRLLNLKIKNFKGIKSFELDINGQSVNIYGDNATGKTTVFDAVLWLLFDKNSENKSDFGIKPRLADGTEMSRSEHEVCGTFDVDGRVFTLKKVFHENWKRPRGKAEEVFAGNTTDYFIAQCGVDGLVPVKAAEYKKFVADFIDEKLFQLLTDANYFNTKLPWKERRDIIMEVCGGITDEEVIAAHAELSNLRELFGAYKSVEDAKKAARYRAKEIKAEMEAVPIRISELQNTLLGEQDEFRALAFREEKEKLQAEVDNISQELAAVRANDPAKNLENELGSVNLKISEIENKALGAMRKEQDAIAKLLWAESAKGSEINEKLRQVQTEIVRKQNVIVDCENKRNLLLRDFSNCKARQFVKVDITTICPTCHQTLPEERVTAAIMEQDEKEKIFNRNKAAELESINKAGLENNTIKMAAEEALTELQKQASAFDIQLEEVKRNMDAYQKNIDSMHVTYPAEHEVLLKRRHDLQESLKAPQAAHDELIKNLIDKRAAVEAKIANGNKMLALVEASEKAKMRIDELAQEEGKLAAAYEECNSQVFLVDSFIRAKTDMLSERINSRFQLARFVMFKKNIGNDGIEECCEVAVNGVPYSDLNNAMRINVGLDVIRTLSEYYKFNAPVFVDNAESVTDLLPMPDHQVIRLVVNPEAKTLLVMTAEEAAKVKAELDKDPEGALTRMHGHGMNF